MENYFDTPATLSTKSILALFETDKEQRKTFVADIVNRIKEGAANPLQVQLQIKAMEDIVKQLTSDNEYRECLLDEAQKQGGKSFSYHNAKFEIKEAGTKYDYSVCEDTEWDTLDNEIAALSEKKKQREKLLQTIPQSGLVVTDPESGETTTIYPPSKTSTTTVAVTLK